MIAQEGLRRFRAHGPGCRRGFPHADRPDPRGVLALIDERHDQRGEHSSSAPINGHYAPCASPSPGAAQRYSPASIKDGGIHPPFDPAGSGSCRSLGRRTVAGVLRCTAQNRSVSAFLWRVHWALIILDRSPGGPPGPAGGILSMAAPRRPVRTSRSMRAATSRTRNWQQNSPSIRAGAPAAPGRRLEHSPSGGSGVRGRADSGRARARGASVRLRSPVISGKAPSPAGWSNAMSDLRPEPPSLATPSHYRLPTRGLRRYAIWRLLAFPGRLDPGLIEVDVVVVN